MVYICVEYNSEFLYYMKVEIAGESDLMFKIAICDDDEVYAELIRNEIINFNKNEYKIYIYSSALQVLEAKIKFDILFLDIEMPEISGIELKRKLEKSNFKGMIVYITNYEQYMNEAFGKNVIAYISKDKIYRVKDILLKFERNNSMNKIIKISDTVLKINDIYYVKADKGYSYIFTKDKSYYFSIYLTDILQRINSDLFMQVHRSFLVNFSYIDKFNEKEITLIDGRIIKLSRKFKDEFIKKYYAYLKEE